MSNEQYTAEELRTKLGEEPNEAYAKAVIYGRSIKDKGRIMTAYVNRQLHKLGYDKIKVADIRGSVERIKQDPLLFALYQHAFTGSIVLDDIMPLDENFGEPLREADNYNVTTPSVVDRESINASLRDYRKIQRTMSAQQILTEAITKEVVDQLGVYFESPRQVIVSQPIDLDKVALQGRTAVVTPADWHIGAVIDNIPENNYNYALFKQRLDEYLVNVVDYVEEFGCSEIVLVHLGDLIEGIDMRKVNQSFEAEFHASKQIALATEALVYVIETLADLDLPLKVGGVGGNHDRFTGNKADAIYGDILMYVVINTLLMLESRGLFKDNVTIYNNLNNIYNLEVTIQNQVSKFVHGDNEKSTDKNRIAKFVKEHPIDNMWFGHYHSNSHNQEDYARMSYMAGSIMGANSYSKSIHAQLTRASQLLTIIGQTATGEPEKFAIPIFFTN